MPNKKLIFHIGPPKCGSTSIQHFFELYKEPCNQRVKFVMLPVQMIKDLNTDEKIVTKNFLNLVDNIFAQNDILILSHEILSFLPKVIDKICDFFSNQVSDIKIIGFSRRSSDLIVSLYHQATFKNKEHHILTKKILLKNNLNTNFLFGFEKILIATILDFEAKKPLNYPSHILLDYNGKYISKSMAFETPLIIKWEDLYDKIKLVIDKYNGKIIVGVLPDKNSSKTLIQDFCYKAGLTLKKEFLDIDLKSNPRYNSQLTESVNSAITEHFETISFIKTIGFIHNISALMDDEISIKSSILKELKDYVDAQFYESNTRFCHKYNLDENYFSSNNKFTKGEIINRTQKEIEERSKNNFLLESYKEINGNLVKTLFKTYQKLQQEYSYNQTDTNFKNKKQLNLKFIWHKTPEPLRKLGRKFIKKLI